MFQIAASFPFLLEITFDLLLMQMIIGQRRVNLRRGQCGQPLADLLNAQSRLPPTGHAMDANSMPADTRFAVERVLRADNHVAQLCRCGFWGQTHVSNLIGLAGWRKRSFFRKLHAINASPSLDHLPKYVLTAKKSSFWGVLAGKPGVDARKKAFYFALFHVLVVFSVCRSLSDNVLQILEVSKKIVPKNLR
jgi:hypothetical protein